MASSNIYTMIPTHIYDISIKYDALEEAEEAERRSETKAIYSICIHTIQSRKGPMMMNRREREV